MINAILNGILNVLTGIINVVFLPIDTLINAAFPNAADGVQTAIEFIDVIFDYIQYPLTFLPVSFLNILILIFTFQIALVASGVTYKGFVKIWIIIQKIKFW